MDYTKNAKVGLFKSYMLSFLNIVLTREHIDCGKVVVSSWLYITIWVVSKV